MVDPLSDVELMQLHSQYLPTALPPCRVCGAALKLRRYREGDALYECSSPAADPLFVRASEFSKALTHRERSRFCVCGTEDERVVRLVEEVRELRAK